MLEITRYIEELKDRLHLKSDYALAHKLECACLCFNVGRQVLELF